MRLPSTFLLARPPSIHGFSLIEIVIVISLMTVLFALGIVMSIDVLRGTTFRDTRSILVSALTSARGRALSNQYNSVHGICYSAPDFVIFRGPLYIAGAVTNDTIPGNPAVTVTSVDNFFTCGVGSGIVFSQHAATTSATGMLTIHEPGHVDAFVSVNKEGAIVW